MPLGFPVDAFSSALAYQAEPGDIFIATYPKCGTTWAQYIVYLLLHDGVPLADDARLGHAVPHLEEVGGEFAAALPEPRAMKTHFSYEMTPRHSRARYIFIARNPFDCAVSFYHHTRGFEQHYAFSSGQFEDFFECFLTGEVDWGDYFAHLASWYAHKDDHNLLFLTYEQMLSDPRAAVIEIAEFLQVPCARDEAVIAAVVEHSSFEQMRRAQDRWSSRRPDGMPSFVRKGVVGDWMTCFTADQAHRLAEKFDRRAAASGFDTLWPEVLEAARRLES